MKRWLFGLILSIFMCQLISCNNIPVAVVVKLKGKSVVIRGKNEIKIQQYMPLYVNDKVKTFSSSYVECVFDTGISLRIEENTVVEIKNIISDLSETKKKFVSVILSVETGSTLTDATVFNDKYQLKTMYVLTPAMVASVRGTVFYIKVSDDHSTTVAVFKGKVESYIGSIDESELDEMIKSEEQEFEYEKRKKVVIQDNEQALFSDDLSFPVVVGLSFSMKEYKRTVVDNFIKTTMEYRKNFDKFKQQRDEWIKKYKQQFIKEKQEMKKKFMEDFEYEHPYKKRR